MKPSRFVPLPALILATLWSTAPLAQPALSLTEAERLALAADPTIEATEARAEALREDAVADGQLPDPKMRIGLYNLPLDSFDISQEPTTQLRFGYLQAIPRGDTLEFRQRRTEWLANAQAARAKAERKRVRQAVREKYLEVVYQVRAGEIVRASRKLFEQLVDVTRYQFAAGRVTQQDVLRAQLELSRLDDRETRIRNQEEAQRANLATWIGEAAWQPLSPELPRLPELPARDVIAASLDRHPLLAFKAAQEESHKQGVQIAREQYKPGWNLGIEYRKRFGENPNGTDRTDMMAAMVTFDLPFFTGQRQDKRLNASLQKAAAAGFDKADVKRKLEAMLAREYANWDRLGERKALYEQKLVREARANAEAALKAYQSGLTEFTTLMRARLTELDVRLAEMRVWTDRARAQARLLYLLTEEEQ